MRLLTAILLLALVTGHVITLGKSADSMKRLPYDEGTSYVLPSPLLKIVSLDFDGLVSDYLFLKAIVFLGSAPEKQGVKGIKEQEWKWCYRILDAATDLDPYFIDPYYFANAFLPWDANMVKETNALLEKGSRHRDWDPFLPYFIGFNYFYFNHDNEKASEWLMIAARRPGASPGYAHLAVQLAFEGKRTENAIMFLEEILKNTDDDTLRKRYEARLNALQNLLLLENAVDFYKKKYRRAPPDLHALIEKKIISHIPQDPYGGMFYIDADGMVKSTSKLMTAPQ
jgi:hypothetical protein